MKKKNNFLLLNKTSFVCISCGTNYETKTVFEEKRVERIISCMNCNPFYSGLSASEMKAGNVEKFRDRARRVKEKKS